MLRAIEKKRSGGAVQIRSLKAIKAFLGCQSRALIRHFSACWIFSARLTKLARFIQALGSTIIQIQRKRMAQIPDPLLQNFGG